MNLTERWNTTQEAKKKKRRLEIEESYKQFFNEEWKTSTNNFYNYLYQEVPTEHIYNRPYMYRISDNSDSIRIEGDTLYFNSHLSDHYSHQSSREITISEDSNHTVYVLSGASLEIIPDPDASVNIRRGEVNE